MKIFFKVFSIVLICGFPGCDFAERKDADSEQTGVLFLGGINGKCEKYEFKESACLGLRDDVREFIDKERRGIREGIIKTKDGEKMVCISEAFSDRIVSVDEYRIRCLLDGLVELAKREKTQVHKPVITDASKKLKSTSQFNFGRIGVSYVFESESFENGDDEVISIADVVNSTSSLFLDDQRICKYEYYENKGGSGEQFKCDSGVTFKSLMKNLQKNGVEITVVCEAFAIEGMLRKDEIRHLRELETENVSVEEISGAVTSKKVETSYAMCLIMDIDKKYMLKK